MILPKLISTGKTIFTLSDVETITHLHNRGYLRLLLARMVRRKELLRLRKGIYTYTGSYRVFELANKIKKPSYVSLETILFDHNVIFQDFSKTITSVSDNQFSSTVDNMNFTYHKIRDDILTHPLGVIVANNARIATIERAVCDMMYLSKNYYFDNLKNIDKNRLLEISNIYNKRVIGEVKKYVRYQ